MCDLFLTKEGKVYMAMQPTIVAGIFAQESQATQALEALKQAGFSYDQMGVAKQGQKNVNLQNDLLGLERCAKRLSFSKN